MHLLIRNRPTPLPIRGGWVIAAALFSTLCLLGGLLGPASAATGQLTATWTDTNSDFNGFKIQRKPGTTGTYAQIATLGPTVMSYLDAGLTAGSTYCYQVAAYNAAGDSPYTPEVCATASAPALYTLSVTRAGSGNVASSPSGIDCGTTCSASIAGGTSVALTATPAPGFAFAGWSGACSGTGACTVILDAAKSVTATFTAGTSSPAATYTLTVANSGTGSGVVGSPSAAGTCAATCSGSLTAGTRVTLTATPAIGSTFTGWSGACTGTGACTVILDAAKSVTATFTAGTSSPAATYTLTVANSGTGSGSVTSDLAGIICGSTCSASFNGGTTVTLSATPTTGSTFTGWSGACTGTGNCSVTLGTATTVTAMFTLSPSATGGPVAAYAFDEGTGTTLGDASGNANTGTLSGPTWTGGEYGNALQFPGTANSVQVPNSASLDIAGTGLTIEFWAMITDISGRDEVFLGKGWYAGVVTPPYYQYGVEFSGGRKQIDFYLGFPDGTYPYVSMAPVLNTWTHVAWTYDGVNINGYLDGVLMVTKPETRPMTARGNDLILGADAGLGQPYVGSLDELRIYSRALTASEIQADMTTPVGSSASAPPTVETLTVTKIGTGGGFIASSPAGVNCSATCSVSFQSGTSVTLAAVTTPGSTFTGWSGACTGTDLCILTLTEPQAVTATFTRNRLLGWRQATP